MKRNVFFIIVAVITLGFGGMMFITPTLGGSALKIPITSDTATLIRLLGAAIAPYAAMNFLVRNQPASRTMQAVLWTNVAAHGLALIAGVGSVLAGTLAFGGAAPGDAFHIFAVIGSFYYLWRMEPFQTA